MMTSDGSEHDPSPKDGRKAYMALPAYAAMRTEEVSRSFAPVVEITDAYGSLISRVVCDLADVPPRDQQERTVRDLLADTFDFLLAWRRSVMEGQLVVGYPLARRAYESLSLLVVCGQDSQFAQKWYEGKHIKNERIRKALATLPMAASEDVLKELYAFFSRGAHPNRALIPMRLVGEGNGFVLGSIGRPNLVLVVDHLLKLTRMWSWFGVYVRYHYRQVLDAKGLDWAHDYAVTAAQGKAVSEWIVAVYDQLLAELKLDRPSEPKLPNERARDERS